MSYGNVCLHSVREAVSRADGGRNHPSGAVSALPKMQTQEEHIKGFQKVGNTKNGRIFPC